MTLGRSMAVQSPYEIDLFNIGQQARKESGEFPAKQRLKTPSIRASIYALIFLSEPVGVYGKRETY